MVPLLGRATAVGYFLGRALCAQHAGCWRFASHLDWGPMGAVWGHFIVFGREPSPPLGSGISFLIGW